MQMLVNFCIWAVRDGDLFSVKEETQEVVVGDWVERRLLNNFMIFLAKKSECDF